MFRWYILPLLIFLPALCQSQQEQWLGEYTYGPFYIYTNVEIDTITKTLKEVAALDKELAARLNLPGAKKRVYLYVYADVDSYTAGLNKHFPGAPSRRALFVMENDKPSKVFTYVHEEFADDLRHEGTHALLHSRVGRIPIWLDEGLAEYFEVASADRQKKAPYYAQIKRTVSYNLINPVPDLKKLEGISEMIKFYERNYRDSWAWMNFMLNDKQRQQVVADYLKLCLQTPDEDKLNNQFPSFLDLLVKRFPDYKTDYKAYWKSL